uniref:(northern house mosquito) hypothetical protein n=1 Tax=Culex pipiens TaxID=7175 RepID=A0A8D8MLL4_CULPI
MLGPATPKSETFPGASRWNEWEDFGLSRSRSLLLFLSFLSFFFLIFPSFIFRSFLCSLFFLFSDLSFLPEPITSPACSSNPPSPAPPPPIGICSDCELVSESDPMTIVSPGAIGGTFGAGAASCC